MRGVDGLPECAGADFALGIAITPTSRASRAATATSRTSRRDHRRGSRSTHTTTATAAPTSAPRELAATIEPSKRRSAAAARILPRVDRARTSAQSASGIATASIIEIVFGFSPIPW